jgi:DNA-binding response OmpR family regulator
MSRILLIEDEPWLGELYVQLFAHQHDVVWRRDAYDAMEQIDQQQPDVIVLDILLPWANGIQLLHELASYSDTAKIPVILFSAALPENLDEATLRAHGVVAALDKTKVKPRQVLATLNGVLRVHADISD